MYVCTWLVCVCERKRSICYVTMSTISEREKIRIKVCVSVKGFVKLQPYTVSEGVRSIIGINVRRKKRNRRKVMDAMLACCARYDTMR